MTRGKKQVGKSLREKLFAQYEKYHANDVRPLGSDHDGRKQAARDQQLLEGVKTWAETQAPKLLRKAARQGKCGVIVTFPMHEFSIDVDQREFIPKVREILADTPIAGMVDSVNYAGGHYSGDIPRSATVVLCFVCRDRYCACHNRYPHNLLRVEPPAL